MSDVKVALAAVGLRVPEIYLPKNDFEKFSVIACDQFSAQPEYWNEVEKTVGETPSALRLMLPEAYLGDNDDKRIADINATMDNYLQDGVLQSVGECFVYLRRKTSTGTRQGLVVSIDLEQYDYSKGSTSMIRATEGTIVERIPPRVKIRKDAPLEMPHIMILVDDKKNMLMDLLEKSAVSMPVLYDFELMCGGGHSTGYKVCGDEMYGKIAETLEEIRTQGGDSFLYAMGDGNHSLATAKACWESIKPTLSESEKENHPARFALVEIVNLFDKALAFEPIHRVLFNVDRAQLERDLKIDCDNPPKLEVLQPLLDAWLTEHPESKIDYVHGEKDAKELGAKPGCLSITFGDFEKDTLFDIVRKYGALPRKSFSMGEARDKRYYLECRKIK